MQWHSLLADHAVIRVARALPGPKLRRTAVAGLPAAFVLGARPASRLMSIPKAPCSCMVYTYTPKCRYDSSL